MKKLLILSFSVLTVFIFIYSCSAEEEDTSPPPALVQPQEPEPDPTQYTLTVTAGEGGAVSTEGGTYDEGTSVTITATPEEGYEFVRWDGFDGIDADKASLTITLNSNTTFEAIFQLIPIYTLTISAGDGGTVSMEGGEYQNGTEIEVIAIPNEGYEFLRWTGAIESENSLINFNLYQNEEIMALFVPETSLNNGLIETCKLKNDSAPLSLGFPRYEYSLRSTGNLKMTLIFVDFNDSPATRDIDQVYNILNPSSKDFFHYSSFGKLNVEFDVIEKWYRMSKASDQYISRSNNTAEAHLDYLSEALSLADPDYDFSQTDTFVVITNPDTEAVDFGPAFIGQADYWNFKADGKTFYTSTNSGFDLDYWGGLWLNHEVLHGMGLPDLYNISGNPNWHGFVGEFSLMGIISGSAPDLFAYEKWVLGWLDEAEIFCASSGESIIDITPIESLEEGTKMVILPINEYESLVIESRRRINLDKSLPEEGVLIYKVDNSKTSGGGMIKVFPEDSNNESKLDLLLKEGETFTFDDYQIEILIHTSNYDRVRVFR